MKKVKTKQQSRTESIRKRQPIAEREGALERVLQAIIEGTASAPGDEFFCSFVRHLATALQCSFTFIAELEDPAGTRARTISLWMGDHYAKNFEYTLAGTPCEKVVNGKPGFFPKGVRELFPDDQWLAEIGAESYLGIPSFDSSGRVIGHLGTLDEKPMKEEIFTSSNLKIFATRAGAELERKRAEEGLRESEERFRQLRESEEPFRIIFEGAPIGIPLLNQKGQFLYTNPTFKNLMGYTEDELKGMTFADITYPDDLAESRQQFKELVEGKRELLNLEKRYCRKDGSLVWASTLGVVVRKPTGEIQYIIAMVQDITERERAEEALRLLSGRLLKLQDEERRRIARELHDTTAQGLCALVMNLGTARTAHPNLNQKARHAL